MKNIWRLVISIDGEFRTTEDTLDECLAWFARQVKSIDPWTPATLIELHTLKELHVVPGKQVQG